MFPFLKIELAPETEAILLGTLAGNLLGVILLACGMAGYMPHWLRGAWLGMAWVIAVGPPILGIALEGWSIGWLVCSLTPTSGMIIATMAARSRP